MTPTDPPALPVNVVFTALPVTDLARALAWYERLLGRPPDMVPNATEAAWELRPGAWIYVVHDSPRAGHGLLTLIVDDLDAVLADLARRGIARAGPIERLGNGGRKAPLSDPDGNTVVPAQPAR